MNKGHWQGEWNCNYGFIYQITNTINGKKYIGRKQCITVKKLPPLKGKRNKRHREVEVPDWRNYTSSCKELNEDILKLGKDKFIFEILLTCNDKFSLAYEEIRLQIENKVLFSKEYYNNYIGCRLKGKK